MVPPWRPQAVPLGMTSLASMARIARHYKGRFNTIVSSLAFGSPVACNLLGTNKLFAAARVTTKGCFNTPYTDVLIVGQAQRSARAYACRPQHFMSCTADWLRYGWVAFSAFRK